MDEKSSQLWAKLSAALKPQVSADTYKRWFSAVKLTSSTAGTVTLLVPNNIYQFWIESNHMPALQTAIESVMGGPRQVKFCCAVGDVEESGDLGACAKISEPAVTTTSAKANG
jgi:chromosomal replication initiation ATPase DnaA